MMEENMKGNERTEKEMVKELLLQLMEESS